MNNLENFIEFINEEWSKNDPIPELNIENKLGIVLLGIPGSGKSTFSNKVIKTKNRNIKSFSTDDVSYLLNKDKSKFHYGSSELNRSYLKNFIKTGQNFIYDTTGANDKSILEITKLAHLYGYKVMFIQMIIDLDTAKLQNKKRGEFGGHMADDDYIDYVYSIQNRTTKDYIKYIKPDAFYTVLNKDGKYRYFKWGDVLKKRKVDKYIDFIKK